MTKVVADITMSLDGFVTGPDPGPDQGLGRGGEPLHRWVGSDDEVDEDVLREIAEAPGAVVMGRRLFDIIDGPHGWSDEMGDGGEHATRPRFFVVTHSAPDAVRLGLDFTFVTDGVASALGQAPPGRLPAAPARPARRAGLADGHPLHRRPAPVTVGRGHAPA